MTTNFERIKNMTLDEMAEFLTTCARYHCIPLNPLKCGANEFDEINLKENNCGLTCNAFKIRQILELLDIQEVE